VPDIPVSAIPLQDSTDTSLPDLGAPAPPPSHKTHTVRTLVYLLLLALAAFAAWKIYQNRQAARARSESQAAALENQPVPVQVVPLQQRTVPIYLTALGTVTPYMSVTVKARVNGELLPVKFTEGQEVRKGETILEIDPKPYQAALDQAKGNLAHDQALLVNAQAEYARYKALFDAGVVSKETYQANQASLGQYQGAIEADKAAVETAQVQLGWCYIQSPIDGRIGLRLVDPGNLITANTTNLVIINQFRPIAVYFTLPEGQLPQVLKKLRHDKQLLVDAYDRADVQKLTSGRLLAADNQIDTTTGTARLKAVFTNSDESLFPNQFVNIHLILEDRPNALVVPTAAIQTGQQGQFVWVAETNDQGSAVAQIVPVKVALAEGQRTILDTGPTSGSRVVVEGAERLRTGQTVTVSTPRPHPGQGTGTGQGTGLGTGTTGTELNPAAGPSSPSPGGSPSSSSPTAGSPHSKE
jgi:membrane fusion protein, multidrug efflux system